MVYVSKQLRHNVHFKRAKKSLRSIAFTLWVGAMLFIFYRNQNKTVQSSDISSHLRQKRSIASNVDWPGYKSKCTKKVGEHYHLNNQSFTELEQVFTDHYDNFQILFTDATKDTYTRESWDGLDDTTFKGAGLCCVEVLHKKNNHHGAVDEFPKVDPFTKKELQDGAIIIHFCLSIYLFAALAIVCDDYFVPALERVSEELQLSEDVAGATFMAAGSSAPELFTSVIGVFIAKSDIGIGTIVGSAVFNILIIIGACGLFVKEDIHLSWWPLFRDSSFYLVTIITLIIVIFPEVNHELCPATGTMICPDNAETCEKKICDEFATITRFSLLGENQKYARAEVNIYESICMLIIYGGYIIIMKFNQPLEQKVCNWLGVKSRSDNARIMDQAAEKGQDLEMNKLSLDHQTITITTPLNARKNTQGTNDGGVDSAQVASLVKSNDVDNKAGMDFDKAGLRVMMSSSFAPRTRLRMAAKLVAKNQENFAVAKQTNADGTVRTLLIQKQHDHHHHDKKDDDARSSKAVVTQSESNNTNNNNNVEEDKLVKISIYNENNNNNSDNGSTSSSGSDDDDDEGASSPWEIPHGYWAIVRWLLAWPIIVTLWYTVPQCGQEKYKHLYMVAFIMATVWIAVYSYFMVWMVAYCGFAFGIPDTIMGLTFLAAGTSVPDTLASIIVAQQGLGDMAVSNSIGSNVFDILLGLALPWSLAMGIARILEKKECLALQQFTKVIYINSNGLVISVALLLASLIFVVSVIHFNGWKLNTKAGILISGAYLCFIVGSIYNESNVDTSLQH